MRALSFADDLSRNDKTMKDELGSFDEVWKHVEQTYREAVSFAMILVMRRVMPNPMW